MKQEATSSGNEFQKDYIEWFHIVLLQTKWKANGILNTCPSAIITRTWYWPPLASTMSIEASTTGAKDVGPATDQ